MSKLKYCQRLTILIALGLNPFFKCCVGKGEPDDLDGLRCQMPQDVESGPYGMADLAGL